MSVSSSDSNRGNLVGRHVVRIILNGSPPSSADGASKPKKKFSQSTSSLVAKKFSQQDCCTCAYHSSSSLPPAHQNSTRENELELALNEVREEKVKVEEEQGRLLALNLELALENKIL